MGLNMAKDSYIYAVARIRTHETKLLNHQFMEQLIAAPDEDAAMKLLVEHGWGAPEMSAEQMEMEIFEYIEIWYNKTRRHATLQNMTIDEFWKLNKKSA